MSESHLAKRDLAASTGEFAELVAAGTPAPGGGSVAAYCGQLAAALGTMICNLTAGKPKFSGVEPRVLEIRMRLGRLADELQDLIDEDAVSFQEVLNAYKLPKTSEEEKIERSAGIAKALKHAIAVPSQTVESSFGVIELLDELAKIGNPNALSDVATAAQVAKAAMKAAYYNVAVNLKALSDPGEASVMASKARQMIDRAEDLADEIENAFLRQAG
jgi:formiminotetrahydrofolate cyclodeaminase